MGMLEVAAHNNLAAAFSPATACLKASSKQLITTNISTNKMIENSSVAFRVPTESLGACPFSSVGAPLHRVAYQYQQPGA